MTAHERRKGGSVCARGPNAFASRATPLLPLLIALAVPSEALAQVVANPGPIVLKVERLDVEYDRGYLDGPSAVGFRFDSNAPPECRDGRNNDDHRAVGQGVQDAEVDFPDDSECASADDDSEDKVGFQPRVEVALEGWVDADGNLTFPAEGVRLPPRYHRSTERGLGGDGVVINTFVASGPVTGRIDPARGTMELQLNLRLRFQVDDTGRLSGPGDRCYLGTEAKPQSITLIADRREAVFGVHPGRARGYYPNDGLVVLAGTNPEPLPGASCCGLFCFGDRAVDHAFGTPAEPGAATVTVIGRISPPLLPAKPTRRDQVADYGGNWGPAPTYGLRLGLR